MDETSETLNRSIITEVGNTISTSAQVSVQRIYWFFTFNNYKTEDIEILRLKFLEICKVFVFQEEIGKNGTKHLQGCIELRRRMRWTEFSLPKNIHWEPTKKNEAAIAYCQKLDSRNGKIYSYGLPEPKAKLEIVETLRPWQQQIVDATREKPDNRTINWLYDQTGNIGKTTLTKYMVHKYNEIFANGGSNKDLSCLIAILLKNGRDMNVIQTFILDLPRSKSKISYNAIEAIKNGMVTSCKYESSSFCFNSPHIWVFSNFMPDFNLMSKDRWKVWIIINDSLKLT